MEEVVARPGELGLGHFRSRPAQLGSQPTDFQSFVDPSITEDTSVHAVWKGFGCTSALGGNLQVYSILEVEVSTILSFA